MQGQDAVRLTLPNGEEWLFSHDGVGRPGLRHPALLDRAWPSRAPRARS
jgi:hypothetical protein